MKLSRILIRTPGLGATVLGLFAAIGCGSGSTNIIHTTGNYSNASLNGTYVYEIHGDSLGGFYREIGAFTADGAGPNGTITGSEDIGSPSGSVSGSSFHAAYSTSSSPANGRGTFSITSGSGSGEIQPFYVISPSKFVAVSFADPNPAIMIFQQSAALPARPSRSRCERAGGSAR